MFKGVKAAKNEQLHKLTYISGSSINISAGEPTV
jgi:hypothetical protein